MLVTEAFRQIWPLAPLKSLSRSAPAHSRSKVSHGQGGLAWCVRVEINGDGNRFETAHHKYLYRHDPIVLSGFPAATTESCEYFLALIFIADTPLLLSKQ